MIDTLLIRLIKRIARARYTIDLTITRLILRRRGEPRFVLAGHCTHCGRCCETPSIHTNLLTRYFKSFRSLTISWHHRINGFEFLSENRTTHILTFRCSHFNPTTKQCDSYYSRPGLCRDYPVNLLFSLSPEFFPECGFRPVDRHAERFKTLLEASDISPETLHRLKDKLHLD